MQSHVTGVDPLPQLQVQEQRRQPGKGDTVHPACFLLLSVPLYSTFLVLFCVLNIQNARLFSESLYPLYFSLLILLAEAQLRYTGDFPGKEREDAPRRGFPILFANFGLMGAKAVINIVHDDGSAPWKPVHLSRVEGWVLL